MDETGEDKEKEREEKHNGFLRKLAKKPLFSINRKRESERATVSVVKIL
jgi:hypothetical protein